MKKTKSLTKYCQIDRINQGSGWLFMLVLIGTCISANTIIAETKKLTTNQIVRQVEQQFSGKLVSIRYQQSTHRYVVEMLLHDGKVHRLIVDANTGKQISAKHRVIHPQRVH